MKTFAEDIFLALKADKKNLERNTIPTDIYVLGEQRRCSKTGQQATTALSKARRSFILSGNKAQ